jgi:hypothetical protein
MSRCLPSRRRIPPGTFPDTHAGGGRAYRLPGFWNAHNGCASLPSIQISSRPNRAGAIQRLPDPAGKVNLTAFQSPDVQVDKNVRIKRFTLQASMDVFNITNARTILARRRARNATTPNIVSGLLPPRIVRFGLRAMF